MCKSIHIFFLLFISLLFLVSCSNNKTPLFKKDQSSLAEKENNLFVFIGEKIDFKELPQEEISMDGKFYGKYKVLQHVYGEYKLDTIEFTAYDHYGIPDFSNYKNVMLFVREHKGKYYHEKYQFYDVYKTADKRWAGRYLGRESKSAQKISFAEEISFPLSTVNKKEIGCWFPAPYYRIAGDKAITEHGIYIENLFKIKWDGILKSRGLFGKGKPGEFEIIETEMAEVANREAAMDDNWKNFKIFWEKIAINPDSIVISHLDKVVLDSIFLNDTLYSKHNSRIKENFSIEVLRKFNNNDGMNYQRNTNNFGKSLFQVTIIVDTINTFETKIQASFVKMKTGFRLYSIKEEKKCICGY